MSYCPSCGGFLGRDCFNPEECAYISHIQEQKEIQEQMNRIRRMEEEIYYLKEKYEKI